MGLAAQYPLSAGEVMDAGGIVVILPLVIAGIWLVLLLVDIFRKRQTSIILPWINVVVWMLFLAGLPLFLFFESYALLAMTHANTSSCAPAGFTISGYLFLQVPLLFLLTSGALFVVRGWKNQGKFLTKPVLIACVLLLLSILALPFFWREEVKSIVPDSDRFAACV